MAQEAAVPIETIRQLARQIAADEVQKFARSGFLRNATISGGAGLRIVDGGILALTAADGTIIFYIGPLGPSLPDGTIQQGWQVRRADGTAVLSMFDQDTSDGVLRQALNWFDRSGNVVLADDTDGGQGHARPHLAHAFYPARNGDFLKTTNASFETVWRARVEKQQPKLYVEAWGAADAAGTTGEIRVMVNSVQLGATQTPSFGVVNLYSFGPAVVDGSYGDSLSVEIQARRTAGTGNVQVGAAWVQGTQT